MSPSTYDPASPRDEDDDDSPSVFSPTQLIRTLVSYRNAILLFTAGLVATIILAMALVGLRTPSQKTISLPFALTFRGAEEGRYPNGTPFQKSEIIGETVLAEVHRANDLARFMSFDDFKRALVVLEGNADLETLNREYAAKLSNAKLNPVDRDRLEREYQDKRAAVSKSGYVLELMYGARRKQLPDALADKVLQDVLNTWAARAARERGVGSFDVSILTANVFDDSSLETNDLFVAADMTRINIDRIINNVDQLATLPSANLIRSHPENLSLAEIRFRLDDLRRFHLQLIIAEILERGPVENRASIRYVETQLRITEATRDAARAREQTIRAALGTYSDSHDRAETSSTPPGPDLSGQRPSYEVAPQLSETFLNELLRLSLMNNDASFRQDLVKAIRDEGLAAVPLENEVSYYARLLARLRTGTGSSGARDALPGRLQAVVAQAKQATQQANNVYKRLSDELNPSASLIQIAGPARTRVEHSIGLRNLVMLSAFIFVIGLVLILSACIVHAAYRRATRDAEARPKHEDPLSV